MNKYFGEIIHILELTKKKKYSYPYYGLIINLNTFPYTFLSS